MQLPVFLLLVSILGSTNSQNLLSIISPLIQAIQKPTSMPVKEKNNGFGTNQGIGAFKGIDVGQGKKLPYQEYLQLGYDALSAANSYASVLSGNLPMPKSRADYSASRIPSQPFTIPSMGYVSGNSFNVPSSVHETPSTSMSETSYQHFGSDKSSYGEYRWERPRGLTGANYGSSYMESIGQNVLQMMDEVSRYSDVHHHQFQDYGSVQRLLHAFFNAMSGDHTVEQQRLLQMNDGTEIGRNRPMANSLFESDIVLTVDQLKGIVLGERDRRKNKSGRRSKRKVITGGVYRWPKNVPISYKFESSDENWRHIIRESIRFWERETCVRWNENGHGVDGVIFVKGAGCYSSVGRTGGRQLISIGQGCGSIGIITHEIGHSLGFWHEQSRPDRDNFIRIISENIAKGTEGNFVKFTSLESDDLGVPFDFGSVMHYGPLAFTKDWKDITIETKDKRYSHTIGQRHGPSFIDVKQVNRLYCYDHCEISSLNCHNGGYPDPNNCTRCKCPMGLGGRLCNEVQPSDCGGELKATKGMKTLTYQGRNKCYWRIKSKNSRIRLVIDSVFLNCETTCQSFLEIKHNSDFQQTGFRLCCSESGLQVTSDQNEMLIIFESLGQINGGNFSLRYAADSGDPLPKPHAPHVPTWVPGREDRDFYSSSLRPGPIETFILNAIPQIRDPNRPIETIASIVTDYTVGTLLGARKS